MSEEMLDIVDENDNVIGECTRHECYLGNHANRLSDIIIKNKQGKILLQKRSSNCSFMPGAWCSSAGGHVSQGQTYIEAAKRELEEEIGIQCDLTFLGKLFYDKKELYSKYYKNTRIIKEKKHATFVSVYEGIYEGGFTLDYEEVESVKFFSLDEIKKMIERGEYMMPGIISILEKYYLN